MTDGLHMQPKHRQVLEALLRKHLPGVEVWAYGSRVSGRSHDGSDLDLVLRGPGLKEIPIGRLGDFEEAVRESTIPFLVEARDWTRLPERFQREIERHHVVLAMGDGRKLEGNRSGVAGDGWVSLRLGDVCTKIGSGATPRGGKKVYLQDGPCALIRSQNVHNNQFHHDGLAFIDERQAAELNNVEVFADDVLLNITGDSVARVCQVAPDVLPARVNQHVAIIRPDPNKLSPCFLRYFLVSPEIQAMLLSWAGSGGTRNALTKDMIESFDVQAPKDVTDQRAIAHILGTLDDKIELNRRMNETLEAMARALFKSWFVDFDPVRAKMAGRDTGLPQPLADLFPNRLVNSELGETPEGWERQSIYRFTDVVYGAPFVSKQFNEDKLGVPLIRIRDLATHEPGVSTEQVHKKGHLIKPGDIVVGMDGEFRMHVWKGPIAWLNQRVCHFNPRLGVPTAFLAEALREPLAFFERGKVGTTVIHLGKSDIDTIRLLYPGQRLLNAFGRIAEPLLDRTVTNALENRTLSHVRDLLLPKFISGEIRIRHA